jgi:hypothetical protein
MPNDGADALERRAWCGDECGGGRLIYVLGENAAVPSATAMSSHDAGGISLNAALAGRVAPNAK